MKKLIYVVLLLCLLFCFTACNGIKEIPFYAEEISGSADHIFDVVAFRVSSKEDLDELLANETYVFYDSNTKDNAQQYSTDFFEKRELIYILYFEGDRKELSFRRLYVQGNKLVIEINRWIIYPFEGKFYRAFVVIVNKCDMKNVKNITVNFLDIIL